MIRRTTREEMFKLLEKNPEWKVVDLASSNAGWKYADVFTDVKDHSEYYNKKYDGKKEFIQCNVESNPFMDKEFDFVIASHVIEHVEDFEFFIKELERISSKGYIELPTRFGDNLVFENKNDHIWWFEYNDVTNVLKASKRNQIIEPFITVATGKMLEEIFRDSLILELYWEEKINYKIDENIRYNNYKKLSFIKIIKKYFSKRIRMIIK